MAIKEPGQDLSFCQGLILLPKKKSPPFLCFFKNPMD
jgi:hypothetical protein